MRPEDKFIECDPTILKPDPKAKPSSKALQDKIKAARNKLAVPRSNKRMNLTDEQLEI